MQKSGKIYIAGHQGLAGSAILRRLQAAGYENIITRCRDQLDLTDQVAVDGFFKSERPQYLFLAAAKVGGIHANNSYPADFIRDNLLIQTLVIDAAQRYGVKKLAFLGSSCIYPKMAPQPMPESALLGGPLEPTNQWYAVAKIAGIKLCQALRRQHGFNAISLMPTNLYGPGDNFHDQNAHVLPALMRRFHLAKLKGKKRVKVWGTGKVQREFLHVDDLADAALFIMQNYDDEEIINVGTGQEVTIAELAKTIRRVVGFKGKLVFDTSKPDGTPRKLLDVDRLTALGWRPRLSLEEGIVSTYQWFLENSDQIRT